MHLSINIKTLNIETDDHSGPFLYNIDLLYILYSNLKIEDGHNKCVKANPDSCFTSADRGALKNNMITCNLQSEHN